MNFAAELTTTCVFCIVHLKYTSLLKKRNTSKCCYCFYENDKKDEKGYKVNAKAGNLNLKQIAYVV